MCSTSTAERRYTAANLARTARRVGNSRRGYLFVNPLQAKHMPVSPGEAMAVMRALGCRIAQQHPDVRVIIGFSETATAIGARAASFAGEDVFYIQTTREAARPSADSEPWLDFSEAHSHAAEQRLYTRRLLEALQTGNPGRLVLVDDEISTGRTCLDLLTHLRDTVDLTAWNVSIASFLSSCAPTDLGRLQARGVSLTSLAVLSGTDYEKAAAAYDVAAPSELEETEALLPAPERVRLERLPDARLGVQSAYYETALDSMCGQALDTLDRTVAGAERILVLGTEECMYPALRIGACLERNTQAAVRCHATTRSPIGVCRAPGYPLVTGHKLHSFYEKDRPTYIYNEASYDVLVVVSDTTEDPMPAMRDLQRLFPADRSVLLEV